MQYMLAIFADEKGWAKLSRAQQVQGTAAYSAYTEALVKSGAMVAGERLRPTSTASTVKVTDGKTKVLDGPYAESKEQLAGYYIIKAKDLDEAIAWAAKCPGAHNGTMEVRPIWPVSEE
ncbi:MAG: YciI family protein [Aestuariivirga sp.]